MRLLRRRRKPAPLPYATAIWELVPSPCLACKCCSSLLCATALVSRTSWLQDCGYHCRIEQVRDVELCPCSAMGRHRLAEQAVTNVTPPPPSLSGA